MAESKFVDLIFNPDCSHDERIFAYRSLVRNPKQLFTLFLKRDISTEFFAAFDLYGKTLAELLISVPEYCGETLSYPIQIGKDAKRFYEENLATFLFSLFPLKFPDAELQESLAAIVFAVITNIPPGGCLELIGAEIALDPSIMTVLIADGRLGTRLRRSINSLASKNWLKWVPVATTLAQQCPWHREKYRIIKSWSEMERFFQSFPCNSCPRRSSARTMDDESRRANSCPIYTGINAFDNNLLGEHLGPWKIVISALALKSLRAVACHDTQDEFKLIQERLQALASGKWIRGSSRRTNSSGAGYRVPVYTDSCQQNVIIWQIDVAFDERYYRMMQVVKVWAICASNETEEIEEMSAWISHAQRLYEESRIEACETVDLSKMEGTPYPQPAFGFDGHSSGAPRVNASSMDCSEAVSLPILGKFFSLTDVVFSNLHLGTSTSVFPVDPSEEELYVINHFKSPAFILGRSGTGKTTCLVYKLASRYLESKAEGQVPARQLLLTRSKRLTQKLKLYTKRLINTRLGKVENNTTTPAEENSATWKECDEDTRQNILSLGDDDFPLVCTFNRFLRLLENSIKTRTRNLSKHPQPVDFDVFRIYYWKCFPSTLTRKIPMELAFLEIIGVIKGSASRETNFDPLSREAYLSKRWKAAPNVTSREERDFVYTLYENYEKAKKRRGELDDIDRLVHIFKELERDPTLRKDIESLLDEVYVDETQDQRPLEIELLLSLIPDPRHIHFAGDTAQSISKDSLFRFANAQALFYSRFSDPSLVRRKQVEVIPELLPLSHNYRSHLGILSVASVVMELLYAGFPQFVDRLPPEKGDNPGPEPTIYIGSNLLFALNGPKSATDEDVEKDSFGADRAILVRDQQARKEIKTKVQDPELILTILESKGMEFDDVFLYDFFTTSPCSDFQVLEKLLKEYHCAGASPTQIPGVNNDSKEKYSARAAREKRDFDMILCSELKHLYVAITRARNRLWIFESQEDTVNSIIHLFNTVVPTLLRSQYPKPLLKIVPRSKLPDVSELQRQFAPTHGTPQAVWIERALDFMEQKNYEDAAISFKKARDSTGEALANAYLAQVQGMEHQAAGNKSKAVESFQRACELFLNAGRVEKAAQCKRYSGHILAAAEILSTYGKHKEAAWDFMEAGCPKKAGREYEKALDHENVLALYYHAGLYNELIVYLKQHPAQISVIKENCRKQYARLCYLSMSQKKCGWQSQDTIRSCLGSSKEHETAAREFGMLNHVTELQTAGRRFQEACELAVNIGLLEDALSLIKDRGAFIPKSVVAAIVAYVHAGRLIATSTKLGRSGQNGNGREVKNYYRSSGSRTILLFEQSWMPVETSLKRYARLGEISTAEDGPKGVLRHEFLILLVCPSSCRRPAAFKYFADGLTQAAKLTPEIQHILSLERINGPLEIISAAIGILNSMCTKKLTQPSVLLFLGFYTPPKSGKCIVMPWSPDPILPKLDFPIRYFTKDIHDVGFQVLLEVIYAALGSIEQLCRKEWQGKASELPGFDNVQWGSHFYYSGHLHKTLLSINVMLIKLMTAYMSKPRDMSPPTLQCRFWPEALIEHLSFNSSFEQDATIITALIKNLATSATLEYRGVYGWLQKFLLYSVSEEKFSQGMTYSVLSTLFKQMQHARLLGMEMEWEKTMQTRVRRSPRFLTLTSAFEVITLFRALYKNTANNFHWAFSESVCKLISKLEQVQSTMESYRLFHSASLLTAYEELTTLMLLLARPAFFVIPRSWASLHLPTCAKIPRFTSVWEIRWYQSVLIRIISCLCDLVHRIEDGIPAGGKRTYSLARRSIHIIAISLINMGTLNPLPADYREIWTIAQKVFGIKSLQAESFHNVQAARLLQLLKDDFTASYDGKDNIRVIVTDGCTTPDYIAELPVPKSAIIYERIPKPRERLVAPAEPNLRIARQNAAYTHFFGVLWRTRQIGAAMARLRTSEGDE